MLIIKMQSEGKTNIECFNEWVNELKKEQLFA